MAAKANKAEVARIFKEMADLLSIEGENPFRVRAYQKAADVIEHLSDDLEELYDEGRLNQVPGIGKRMVDKIETIFATGELPEHQKLKSSFPSGLIEILSVPDVGPKTVKLLYEKVGVENIEDLERVAREGKLRGLPGLGAKKEENVLRGIRLYRTRSSRVLLGKALPLVYAVIDELKEKGSSVIEKISPAGSLRRGKETIGDIDILATSPDASTLMDVFTNLSFTQEVLAKGETKSSILAKEDLQMDLRVVSSDCFGAAIQYFTGSKSHNIKLRERALRRDLKINEYGVFAKDEEKIAGKNEAQVYEVLGLPLIPPELREDRGEIEAAAKGMLPDLLTEKAIKGDLHVHTDQSDGRDSIQDIVEEGRKRGYQYIAITDHASSLRVAGGLSPKEILIQVDKIRELNSRVNDIKVLTGTEANVQLDGSLDLPDEILRELEVVIASVHTGFKQDQETITRRAIKAIRHPLVHIFAHPTGRLLGEREAYAINLDKVLDVAAEEGVWLEINSQPERLDLTDYWAMEAKKRGVKIVINTDAHSTQTLDYIKLGVLTARRGWLEQEHVMNTLPVQELTSRLKQIRREKHR